MTSTLSTGLLAVDVGSSRVKLGWYAPPADCPGEVSAGQLPMVASGLPLPEQLLELDGGAGDAPFDTAALANWLDMLPMQGARCLIASVRRATSRQLQDLLTDRRFAEVRELRHDELPIANRTEQPERVGIDRLLCAVSANHLRHPDRAAIVVDMGSAITVDLVAADGGFEGGAILPGIALAARALQAGTDVLPQVDLATIADPPDALGQSTRAAIAAGLHWGALGAVREIIARLGPAIAMPRDLFITGGDARRVADDLSTAEQPARLHEQMVLSGIRLTDAQP